eukprot:503886-Rhodomonas_salina.1
MKDPYGSMVCKKKELKRKRVSSKRKVELDDYGEEKDPEYGWVYFMHLQGIGVKVGKSIDPYEREKQINRNFPET